MRPWTSAALVVRETLEFPLLLLAIVRWIPEALELLEPRRTHNGLRLGGRHTLTGHCLPSGNAAVVALIMVLLWHLMTRAPRTVESLVFPLVLKSSNLGDASQ